MILSIGLASLILLYMGQFIYPLLRRLPPDRWSALVNGWLVTGTSALVAALLSIASPVSAQVAGTERLTRLCDRLLSHLPHGLPWVAWGALSLLVLTCFLGLSARCSISRQLESLYIDPCLSSSARIDGHDLIVLPSARVFAYSRSGDPHQVVLSQGLVEALSEAEMGVVIRHEQAHLDAGDDRKLRRLLTVDRSLSWLPGLTGTIHVARTAIERAADERAAGTSPEQRLALATALKKVSGVSLPEVALAFGPAKSLAERIEAMERPSVGPSGGRNVPKGGGLLPKLGFATLALSMPIISLLACL